MAILRVYGNDSPNAEPKLQIALLAKYTMLDIAVVMVGVGIVL